MQKTSIEEADYYDLKLFLSAFVKAFENLAAEDFRAMFADDATVFFPRPPISASRATGRLEFEACWDVVFRGIREKSSVTTPPYHTIVPLDTLVQPIDGSAVVSFQIAEPDGALSRRTLVIARILGELKIVHLHASVR